MRVRKNTFKFHAGARYYKTFICLIALFSLTANTPAGPLNSECVIVLHGLGRTEASMEKIEKGLIKNNYQVWNQEDVIKQVLFFLKHGKFKADRHGDRLHHHNSLPKTEEDINLR